MKFKPGDVVATFSPVSKRILDGPWAIIGIIEDLRGFRTVKRVKLYRMSERDRKVNGPFLQLNTIQLQSFLKIDEEPAIPILYGGSEDV